MCTKNHEAKSTAGVHSARNTTIATAVLAKLFTAVQLASFVPYSSSVRPVANATMYCSLAGLLYSPYPPHPKCLDVPPFADRCSHIHNDARDPSSERWNYVGENQPVLLLEIATSTSIQGSFTCRKSTTCDPRLYFPSEGRRAEDFFALKNPDGFGRV